MTSWLCRLQLRSDDGLLRHLSHYPDGCHVHLNCVLLFRGESSLMWWMKLANEMKYLHLSLSDERWGWFKKKKKNLLQGCNVGAYLSQMSARTEQGWFFFLFAELQYQTSQRQMRVKSFIRPRSDACAFQIMSVIEENVNLICSWPRSTSSLREFLKLSSLIQSSDVTIWSCNLETLKSLWFKNTHQISLSPKRTGLTLDVGFVYLSLSCFCFCAW